MNSKYKAGTYMFTAVHSSTNAARENAIVSMLLSYTNFLRKHDSSSKSDLTVVSEFIALMKK